VTLLVEDDVGGLQVTVDETALMGVSEPCGDLGGDRFRARVAERLPPGEAILERSSREVFEDHVGTAALPAVVEQPADVRVRERRDRARFALEAHRVGPGAEELDGDSSVELQVVRNPDLGHSSCSERFLEPVATRDRLPHDRGSVWRVDAPARNLVSIEEAQRLVLARVERLPVETVPIADAGGRVLAEPGRAAVDLPPFDSSAMDGFALRAADSPGRLPVSFRIAAGSPAPRPLEPGEAMGIATGGVVPAGADAVIPFEYVVEHDNTIELSEPVAIGESIRSSGGDVHRGEVVVDAGARLGPAQLGALAAAGIAEVLVARRPRAAVLATGSELRWPGELLEPGQIYEANGLLLAAQLESAGAEVERLSPVADDEAAHREALSRGLEADVLVTSGGVSVGPHDLVRMVEAELGVEEVFWGVAMKPGKPISFGVLAGRLVFGLPGNPVSALVGFELFVRPALLALQGAADPLPRFERGRLARALEPNAHRDELVRARLVLESEGPVLDPLPGRESHLIVRAAAADALVLVPMGEHALAAGDSVEFLRL
jgi:molybdopterin molybdotransferase